MNKYNLMGQLIVHLVSVQFTVFSSMTQKLKQHTLFSETDCKSKI